MLGAATRRKIFCGSTANVPVGFSASAAGKIGWWMASASAQIAPWQFGVPLTDPMKWQPS